tara:strand:- start:135000 stop:135263 length:264 start_codon:yes stop_codon:yes gene_type:complete
MKHKANISYEDDVEKRAPIDLTGLKTRQLMSMMATSRKFNNGIYKIGTAQFTSTELLKKELDTREHVPNREERKKTRQEKARKGRNR